MAVGRDAILGIVFGSIFGLLFAAVCIISAIKAVKDRKRIKAQRAERKQLQTPKGECYNVIDPDRIANDKANSIEDECVQTQIKWQNEDTQREEQATVANNVSSNKQNETRELPNGNLNKVSSDLDQQSVTVEINSSSLRESQDATNTPEGIHAAYFVDSHTADLDKLYSATVESENTEQNDPTDEQSDDVRHTVSDSNILQRKSSNDISATNIETYPHKAWENDRPESRHPTERVSTVIDIDNEAETNPVGSRAVSQWTDKTYFGTRNGSLDMNTRKKFVVDSIHEGYSNAAFE